MHRVDITHHFEDGGVLESGEARGDHLVEERHFGRRLSRDDKMESTECPANPALRGSFVYLARVLALRSRLDVCVRAGRGRLRRTWVEFDGPSRLCYLPWQWEGAISWLPVGIVVR